MDRIVYFNLMIATKLFLDIFLINGQAIFQIITQLAKLQL